MAEADPSSHGATTAAVSPEDKGPYSVSGVTDLAEFAWTDGDIHFTPREIRVTGDTVLPRICIRTGDTGNLREQVSDVTTVTPAFLWFSRLVVGAMLVYLMLSDWIQQLTVHQDLRGSFMICGVLVMLSHAWLGHKTRVTWYLAEDYASRKERWRRLMIPLLICTAVAVIIGIYLTGSLWWLTLMGLVFFISVAGGSDASITGHSHYNGVYVLRGHSAAFAHAWADRVAAGGLPEEQSTSSSEPCTDG